MQARPRLLQVERRPEGVRTPGERFGDLRRLVVVCTEPLASLVLSLPAAAALRKTYPEAWLAMLVRPSTAPLARLATGVDEVIEDTADSELLTRTLREFRADLLVTTSPGGRIPWAATTTRIPHRVGPAHRVYSPLFDRRVDERRRAGDRHEVEYTLSYAHRAGAPGGPASFPIAVPEAATESSKEWLGERKIKPPYVVLRPESSRSCPPWPFGHFMRLAALLRAEGVDVVFSIGPTEAEASQELDRAELGVRRLPRFTGEIPTVAACLSRAALVVGHSTGPVHLAAALGAPTLALHGPWPSCGHTRWGPYAANGWCLVAESDEVRKWSARERARRGEGFMATISPAAALSCALAILDGRPPRLP